MAKKRNNKSALKAISPVFMILALLWLTVSAPFVQSAFQARAEQQKMANHHLPLAANDEENANPLGNSTEEKAPNQNVSFSEEYLHDHHKSNHVLIDGLQYGHAHDADTYIAYHGELDAPPPDAA